MPATVIPQTIAFTIDSGGASQSLAGSVAPAGALALTKFSPAAELGYTVEIAFASAPDDTVQVWTDVTRWVQVNPGIQITRGRQDELSQVQPSRCSLVLNNADGRFTPERPGPYYPNVKKGRRLRVTAVWSSQYRRFTGYIDDWIVTWPDAKANQSYVSISASSRLARLGLGAELRSIISEEILYDSPRAYYTFGEAEGAVQAGNTSNSPWTPMTARLYGTPGSGGIFFGTATGPPTDGLTAARFDMTAPGGFYMAADYFDGPLVTSADTTIALECFFLVTDLFTQMELVELHGVSSLENSQLYVSGGNQKLTAEGFDTDGGNNYLLSSVGALNANQTYHAMVTESISGGTLTAKLYLNGVLQDTGTAARSSYHDRFRLTAGGKFNTTGLFDGVMSHVAVYAGTTLPSAARIAVHSDAGSTGFSGERSDQRIDRLARLAGIPDSEVSTETGMSTSLTNQITNGETALALMQNVAATEGGVLFDAKDGTLTFHARSHRYNASSALTLGTKEIQSSLEPKLDDEGLVNDITASRATGPITRVVDTASITEYGLYQETFELLTTSDNEVVDAANWKLNRRSTPRVRVPAAAIDVRRANTAQTTAILAREIGDLITLTSLPGQAPASSMKFFIEGTTEQITDLRYQITFNLSPADLGLVWQLDSTAYSALGTTTRLGY